MAQKNLVLIIKTEAGSTDENIEKLKETFSGDLFITKVVKIPLPLLPATNSTNTYKDMINSHRVQRILDYSKKNFENLNVIIVLDTSVTSETRDSMQRKIESIMDLDLVYLSKWYLDSSKLKNLHGEIYETGVVPKGIQSIFISKKIRDVMLAQFDPSKPFNRNVAKLLKEKKVKVYSFIPNIVNFDIKFAKNNEEYSKLNEFAPIQSQGGTSQPIAMVWMILILILIVFTAWAVIQLGPDDGKERPLI